MLISQLKLRLYVGQMKKKSEQVHIPDVSTLLHSTTHYEYTLNAQNH